jgi:alpha-glucosidase (family GH31 glycosyl hydrolase)
MTERTARPPALSLGVLSLELPAGERWWGGAVPDGGVMPFGDRPHHRDLAVNAGLLDDPTGGANQSAPLLLSNRGRYVWSDRPFAFTVTGGRLQVQGPDLVVGQGAEPTLAAAFRAASAAHFPPAGRAPARAMFTGPQYNTWIEMPFAPTQRKVLDYVRGMLDAGLPPGPVMIDDLWAQDYGSWQFDRSAFPDPTAMVAQLHDWGCPVLLWVVPFISPDSRAFRAVRPRGLLIRRRSGRIAIREWWNGFSAMLDLTNPAAVDWLCGELDTLRDEHGIDGFKFDAGDVRDYRSDDVTLGGAEPVDLCQAWAELGQRYAYNEFRACWRSGGAPLAQRLHDKPATWDERGLGSLIPESIAQGLIGHPFSCPDMIGGGDLWGADDEVDQELFVRYAQVAALHPMMQFSRAPQRVLDAEHLAIVRAAVALRERLLPDLLALVDHAARTGEPILRSLAWLDPDDPGPADQFLLGSDLLVAPVLEPASPHSVPTRGQTRSIRLPPGRWQAQWDGADRTVLAGPTRITVPVDLSTLPWFRRV